MKPLQLFNTRSTITSLTLNLLFVVLMFGLAACGDVSDSETSPTVGPTATARPQAEIVAESKSSVIRVETTTNNGEFTGSGFVLAGNNDVIATAYHVVEDANTIWIRREGENDSSKIPAELIAFDEITDLALLRVTPLGGGIELSDSSLDAGKSVLALGFPLGLLGSVSVSQGIISRRVEFEGDFFVQHDAEIMQGNSGGPLLDDSGRVIGINILVVPDGVITSAGLNFAVHVGELIELMQSVDIESSIVSAIPTATAVPTPTLSPSEVDAAATAVLRLREIDSISATSTVLARSLNATVEVESTAAAIIDSTKTAETAKTEAVENVSATLTARSDALASVATAEAAINYCDGNTGEILLSPISGSVGREISDDRSPVFLVATDFEAEIDFINPSDGLWDYGLLFRSNGSYGEVVLFSPRSDQPTGFPTDFEHFSLVRGDWVRQNFTKLFQPDYQPETNVTRYENGIKGNFLSFVREINQIRLVVSGTTADLYTNGVLASTLKLVIPATDQIEIRPILGFYESQTKMDSRGVFNHVDRLDFRDFTVSCG